MKKINSRVINVHFVAMAGLMIAGILVISSCRKRIPISAENCQIGTVTVTGNGDTTVYHLSYDHSGRPASLQATSSEGAGSSSRTYAYADTNLVVKTTRAAVTTDSVTLNSQGLMLVDVARNGSNALLQTTYYYYTGTEVDFAYVCAACEMPGLGPGGPDEEQYNWTNGDLTAFIPQAGMTTTTSTTYSYNSSAAAVGDYFSITQLLSAPAPTVRTTNQVSAYFQNYGTSTVSYSHDASGRISGMSIITTGPAMFGYGAPDTVNYAYTYQCEVSFPVLEKN
jgi:hypothetical protein